MQPSQIQLSFHTKVLLIYIYYFMNKCCPTLLFILSATSDDTGIDMYGIDMHHV